MSHLGEAPPPPVAVDPDSLEFFIQHLDAYNDYDDFIYQHLAPVDIARLRELISRLQKVEALSDPKTGESVRKFNGRKSAAKGKVYERLITSLCKGIRAFRVWDDVTSELNQLDVLVTFGPLGLYSYPFRDWGTHCICECKFHGSGFDGDWLHKLQSVLQLHGAKVGLLFCRKGISNTGPGARLRNKLHFMAGRDPYNVILVIDWDDLEQCANGLNFIKLLTQRYVETLAGVKRLELLCG